MTRVALRSPGCRALLLDIEGTTTPIVFVHDVLFPFARQHLREYLHRHSDDPAVQRIVESLSTEYRTEAARGESPPPAPPPGRDAPPAWAPYLEWLMERDRKSPALKSLQGLIWHDGYRSGELRGEVFPDVAPALHRWRAAGIAVAIYSSGSEQAQRLLFASTLGGDLTSLFAGFFDTRMGAKVDASSYRAIAGALGVDPPAVAFVSDVVKELDAARAAGMRTILSVRPGNPPQEGAGRHDMVRTFDEILVESL